MATRDEIYTAIRNADAAGDSEAVNKLAAYLKSMPQEKPQAPKDEPGKVASVGAGLGKGFGQVVLNAQNLVGKGLSSFGPSDTDKNFVQRAGDWLQKDATEGLAKNQEEFAPYKEANPISASVGEVGGQLIATAPVGAALGAGAKAAGLTRTGNALASSGFTTGGVPAGANALTRTGDMALRMGAGATVGGISAGLVDPESAATGAAVGAALPPAAKLAGMAGKAVGNVLAGPQVPASVQAGVTAARNAGYVIPPTQAKPTLANRVMEGFSGKLTTAQNASARNQLVTNKLANDALGLPADTVITPSVLKNVRDNAGQAYNALSSAGTVTPGKLYDDALDKIAAPHIKASQGFPNAKPSEVLGLVDELRATSFDAGSAVEKLKELRSAADDAFRAGKTDVARASKAAATALEDALERHLSQSGQTQLLDELRDARKLIAKTYSVEKALNPASGSVDARKLASQLAKGKPLSGELKQAAEFAAQFPKAAQTIEGMGSLPQTSPLDWSLGGVLSAASANPLMMGAVVARPAARSMILSPAVQNRLATQSTPSAFNALAMNPELQQLAFRAAPVLSAR